MNTQDQLKKLIDAGPTQGIYGVWYKTTPNSEWVLFKNCNDFFDTIMMVSVVRELLPKNAVVKYF